MPPLKSSQSGKPVPVIPAKTSHNWLKERLFERAKNKIRPVGYQGARHRG